MLHQPSSGADFPHLKGSRKSVQAAGLLQVGGSTSVRGFSDEAFPVKSEDDDKENCEASDQVALV